MLTEYFRGRAIVNLRLLYLLQITIFFSTVSTVSAEAQDSWGQMLQQQVQLHPDIIAGRANSETALANAEALETPLFNPELEAEIEKQQDFKNYRVGVNQQLDLWNQRGAQKQQAKYERLAAQSRYQYLYAEKLAQALSELIEYRAAGDSAAIAQQLETQFESLSLLVKERQQVGDLGAVDAALINFSLSRQLQEAAVAQVRLRLTQERLKNLLPNILSEQTVIPDKLWQTISENSIESWIDQHPKVNAAKLEWEIMREAALVAQRQNKATPTIGINAGEEENETIVGLSITLPLHIRNTYSAQNTASSQLVLAAESKYRAMRREQLAQFNSNFAELEQYQHSYRRWQTLVADQIETSAELLEQQWRTGDLTTGDYLLALQQRGQGLEAGIELRRAYHQAVVDCLFSSGKLRQTLNNL